MRIGICYDNKSYSPEIFAYSKYLEKKGVKVNINSINNLGLENDAIMYLMGFKPFWKHYKFRNLKEIHEYSSLSINPFAKIKDFLKTNLNVKPTMRIFNSEIIKKNLNFNDDIPYIYRDAGVDEDFFNYNNVSKKEYDLVYAGSTDKSRVGLDKCIKIFLNMGLSVLIVGKYTNEFYNSLKNFKNVEFTGQQSRDRLPHIYSQVKYGLNYTPNVYPVNLQDSLKTKEYCAAGLKVVSNKYYWVKNFCEIRNGKFLWLHNIKKRDDIDSFDYITPDVRDLKWNTILEKCNFYDFIKSNLDS